MTSAAPDFGPGCLPLLDQLMNRYGERVSIEYRQRDPGAIVIDFVVK